MNKPSIGSQVKVLVKHEPMAAVFSPAMNMTFGGGSLTKEFVGEVIKSSLWLKPDEFAMSTGLQDFPVRIINMKDVITIDGTTIEKTEDFVETKEVQGSNGSVYQVLLKNDKPFSCTCPGFIFRKQCRHVDGQPMVQPPKAKKSVESNTRSSGGQTKAEQARVLYKELKGDRKACIIAFMEKLAMSKASAQTYFYTIKGARK